MGSVRAVSVFDVPLDELRSRTSQKWRRYPADVLPLFVAEMDVRVCEPVERALADERGELSAPALDGLPTMALGPRCDVATGADKAQLIGRLVRSMAPDVVVTDELGDEGDARAVYEAACAGVMVLASAHAADIPSALRKRGFLFYPQKRIIFAIGVNNY